MCGGYVYGCGSLGEARKWWSFTAERKRLFALEAKSGG